MVVVGYYLGPIMASWDQHWPPGTNTGLPDLNTGLPDLNTGLPDSNDGLTDSNDGLTDSNDGLTDWLMTDLRPHGLVND